VDRGAKLKDK